MQGHAAVRGILGVWSVLVLSSAPLAASELDAATPTVTTEFSPTDGLSSGRSAFTPPTATLPAEKSDVALAAPGFGGCSASPARDAFGDSFRACATRAINPTEDDEYAFAVSLEAVGFRVSAAQVWAPEIATESWTAASQPLAGDRFAQPAATAAN